MKKVLLALALALISGLTAGCLSADALQKAESPFDDPVVARWTQPQAGSYAPGAPVEGSGRLVCHPGNLAPRATEGQAAQVVRIVDGDTIDLHDGHGTEFRARLWGIDAPEIAQPYGNIARTGLGVLAPQGAVVTYYHLGVDAYGRTLVSLGYQGRSINVLLVGNGLAYHVDRYDSIGNPCLELAQRIAQRAGYHIWEESDGQERPWDFRQRDHQNTGEGAKQS